MLKSLSRGRLVGAWFAAVAVLMAFGVVMGVNVTLSTAALLLAACLVPPAVMLLIWHGAPPVTIRELLHAVDTPKAGRS